MIPPNREPLLSAIFGSAFALCASFMLVGCTPLQGGAASLPSAPVPTAQSLPSALPPTAAPTRSAPVATLPSAGQLTVTGWFITVWNGEPHYSVADDQGLTWQLDLPDDVARPFGGPLELDRKRVTVVGELLSTSPRRLRAISIRLEPVK